MQEKEIEKLQAEKEKVERQLAQEQHKIQRLATKISRSVNLDKAFFNAS